MTDPNVYLTQRQLAERYGISVSAVRKWRDIKQPGSGPKFYEYKTPFKPQAPRIRYRLADVLAWEVSEGIHPINP